MLSGVVNFIVATAETVVPDVVPKVNEVLKAGQDSKALSDVTDKVNEIGGGGLNLVSTVGIWGVILSLVIGGISFAIASATGREEAKRKIVGAILGGIVIFGAPAFVAFIQQFAGTLF